MRYVGPRFAPLRWPSHCKPPLGAFLGKYYQDNAAVFSLEPIDLIADSLPRRQQRLVAAWAELHQAELVADWQRLQAGQGNGSSLRGENWKSLAGLPVHDVAGTVSRDA